MKINIEFDAAAPDGARHAAAAAVALTALAGALLNEPQPAIPAQPAVSAADPARTRAVKPRGTRVQPDPVAAYNKLAAVAGAAPIPTAEDAAPEPEPTVIAEPTPEPEPKPTTTPDERRAAVKTAAVERGILWVRDNIMAPYKVQRMAELTDEQVNELCAKIAAEPAATAGESAA